MRVGIDEQDLFLQDGEAGRQVDGGGGLPDTSFLVSDSYNFSHGED